MTEIQYKRSDKNLSGRAFKGAGYLAAARLVVRSVSLINLVVLSKLLSPEDFGIAALAFTAMGLIQVVSDIRINEGLMAIDEISPSHLDTAFTMQLLRGVVMASLLVALSGTLADFMNSGQLAAVLQVLAVVLLIDGVRNPAYFVYQRNLDFSRELLRNGASAVLASIATIAFAWTYESYWALVVGAVVQRGLMSALTFVNVPYRPGVTLRNWREFLGFGVWLTMSAVLSQLALFAPQILIGKLISPAVLGVFVMGRSVSSLATRELMEPLRRTLFPSFGALKHDMPRLRAAILNANRVLLCVSLPLGFGIAFFAPEIVFVLLGEQWLDAVVVIRLLAPAASIAMTLTVANSLMLAMGKSRSLFLRAFLVTVVTWPLVYVGTTSAGLAGAAVAVALSTLPELAVNLGALRRYAGIAVGEILASGWRAYLSILMMCAALTMLRDELDTSLSRVETVAAMLLPVSAAAATFIGTHVFLWLLSGKPNDIESFILDRWRARSK